MVQEALETMWWFAAIVEVIVDAHHDSEVFALGRCGDDDLFGAGLNVALRFLGGGEQAGGLNDDVHAEFLPRQAAGLAGTDHFHLVAVDDDCVIPPMGDFAGEGALRRVVFHKVGEAVCRDDVAHGHYVDCVADEALFHHCTISQTADAAESVDCYFYCHS